MSLSSRLIHPTSVLLVRFWGEASLSFLGLLGRWGFLVLTVTLRAVTKMIVLEFISVLVPLCTGLCFTSPMIRRVITSIFLLLLARSFTPSTGVCITGRTANGNYRGSGYLWDRPTWVMVLKLVEGVWNCCGLWNFARSNIGKFDPAPI